MRWVLRRCVATAEQHEVERWEGVRVAEDLLELRRVRRGGLLRGDEGIDSVNALARDSSLGEEDLVAGLEVGV